MTRQSRDQLQGHPTSRRADKADKLLRAKRDAPHRRAHSLPRRRWQPRIKISGKRQDAVEVLLKWDRGLRQWPSLLSARKHQQEAAPTSRNFRLLLRGVPCEPVVLSRSQLDTSAGPFPPPPQTLATNQHLLALSSGATTVCFVTVCLAGIRFPGAEMVLRRGVRLRQVQPQRGVQMRVDTRATSRRRDDERDIRRDHGKRVARKRCRQRR